MKFAVVVSSLMLASLAWAQGMPQMPMGPWGGAPGGMTPFPQTMPMGVMGPGQMFPGQMNPPMQAVGEQPAMNVAGSFDCVTDRNGETRLIPRGGGAIQAPIGHQ